MDLLRGIRAGACGKEVVKVRHVSECHLGDAVEVHSILQPFIERCRRRGVGGRGGARNARDGSRAGPVGLGAMSVAPCVAQWKGVGASDLVKNVYVDIFVVGDVLLHRGAGLSMKETEEGKNHLENDKEEKKKRLVMSWC